MLPTFVIGMREGVEASLIVGIIAAFVQQQGRPRAMRYLWAGVAGAVALCLLVAVILRALEQDLPAKQQEGLETVVGLVAVAMVTYMILWMTKHARGLKQDLEGKLASALSTGSTNALVFMAFLAVLREGFETTVFLLAAFQVSIDPVAGGIGAALGLMVAVLIGWAIYKGGVRVNLGNFFRVTGLVLVFVAAGLVASAVHSAHNAGWWDLLQTPAMDIEWLVQPGSVQAALLTGMLGIRAQPTVGEVVGWLLYVIPVGILVLRPTKSSSTSGSSAALVTA